MPNSAAMCTPRVELFALFLGVHQWWKEVASRAISSTGTFTTIERTGRICTPAISENLAQTALPPTPGRKSGGTACTPSPCVAASQSGIARASVAAEPRAAEPRAAVRTRARASAAEEPPLTELSMPSPWPAAACAPLCLSERETHSPRPSLVCARAAAPSSAALSPSS
jgi:hypothetical protein